MSFPASLDSFALWSSLALVAALVGLAAYLSARSRGLKAVIAVVVLVGGVGLAIWQAPRDYQVEPGQLAIRGYLTTRMVPLTSPVCTRLDASARDRHTRVRGSGGFLGYFGTFAEPQLGTVEWHATRRDTVVLVSTAARHIVVSPNDPDAFIRAVCGAAS